MRKNSTIKIEHHNMPLTDLLLVIFVVLKLTGVIDWSWWWVLSPLWIWWSVALIIMAFAFITAVIRNLLKRKH